MTERHPLLMLIDGHALAFRAFFALAEQGLRASNGEPTYAVFGFTSILLGAIQDHRPEYVAVAFDIGRTFRDDMYAEYKAGRAETPGEFEPQLIRIKQVVQALNIPIFTAEGFEADDVIGTLARQATTQQVDTIILTGDTDTLQLVDDHVRVLLANPFGKKMSTKTYDVAQVLERYNGLRPDQLADLRGLKGDTSDNIPGVKGIGEAGAIALLNQFGTVENLYQQLADAPKRYQKPLDGQREVALFSKKLATIVCDAPVTLDLRAARLHDYDRAAVYRIFQELEMGTTLIPRLPASGGGVEVVALPESDQRPTTNDDAIGPGQAQRPTGESQQLAMFDMGPAPAPPPAAPITQHGDYQAVRTEAELSALVAILAAAPAIAFDTETSSLSPLSSTLVGISVAVTPGSAWYIPLAHTNGEQLPRERVLAALKPFFADPHKPKYGHNAKFDIEALEHAGMAVVGVTVDTMLVATLLDKRKGLKELAFYELKLAEPMTDIEALIGKRGKNQISFADVPIEQATPYAAADADMTLRLVGALLPQLATLERVEQIFTRLEMPLLPVLVRMEQAGIGINAEFLRGLSQKIGQRLAALEHEIYSFAGGAFNINSGAQLSDVLFGKLGIPSEKLERTKTGQISLTAAVLEGLRENEKTSHPIIELILQHRQLSKLKSTYVDALPDLVNPETGRVHTTYSQIGAATGRMASNDPNLQNIPTRTDDGREIRRGFVAAPGHVFLATDYSQIELRVLAHITQDENLIQAFHNDLDIHAATAARLFGVAVDQVNKNQRRIAKTVVFGVIYGISSFGLAQRTSLSRTEAQALIDTLFAQYPKLRDYIDRTLADGARLGYVQSLFGRRRTMPDLQTKGPRGQAAQREAINAPIQATAADIMKLAMINVDTALRQSGLATKMLLQVHDELIFEVPHGEVEQAVKIVCDQMEGAYELRVPLKVESEVGPNWLEMQAR